MAGGGVQGGRVYGGRFELEEQVATGAVSWCFRAMDRKHVVPVRLEVLVPDDGQQSPFGDLQAAAAIDHRNVARTLAAGRDHGSWFLATEWVEGRPLDQVIGADPSPSPERLAGLTADLIDGVAAAHRCGVVHGALTPDRVIMAPDGRLRITGFGLGAAVEGSTSPSASGDLRAVGVLVRDVAGEHGVSPGLDVVVDRLLDGSYGSAPEAREALHELTGDERTIDGRAEVTDPGRPRWVKAVSALLVLVIIGGVGLFLSGRLGLREPSRPRVEVPELVGLSQDEAVGLLDAAALQANIQVKTSADAPRDEVVGQDPAPGTTVRQGDQVTVVVSAGREGP